MSKDIKENHTVFGHVCAGRFFYDPGTCFGINFFDNEADADEVHARVRKAGRTYNGGWFHGELCGREKDRDYTDDDGVRWYAVTD